MDGYTPHFNDLSQWKLNSETGEWTIGDGNNYIANNEFDADRVDVKSLTGWECSDSTDGSVNGNVKARRFYGNYAAKQSADTDYTARIKQTIKDLQTVYIHFEQALCQAADKMNVYCMQIQTIRTTQLL